MFLLWSVVLRIEARAGVLLGSRNDITNGLIISVGGLSALSHHSHRRATLNGSRNWANIGYSVFLGGIGWTICS
jgi:hypothetical protein